MDLDPPLETEHQHEHNDDTGMMTDAADIDVDEPPGLMADIDEEDDFWRIVDEADAEMVLLVTMR